MLIHYFKEVRLKMTFDNAYDIYQDFLDSVDPKMLKLDLCTSLDDGTETAILVFANGFNVKLFNDSKLEEGAWIRCWWETDEKNAISIISLKQLTNEFNSHN